MNHQAIPDNLLTETLRGGGGSVSVCRDCNKPILWARRADDPSRWARPLDAVSVGAGMAIVNDCAVFTNIYLPHVCEVAVKAAAEAKVDLLKAKAVQGKRYGEYMSNDRHRRAAQGRMHEAGKEVAFQIACSVPCVMCEVPEGEHCINLTKAGKGTKEYIQWPHIQRFIHGEHVRRNDDLGDAVFTRFSTTTKIAINQAGVKTLAELEEVYNTNGVEHFYGLGKRGRREVTEFMDRLKEQREESGE